MRFSRLGPIALLAYDKLDGAKKRWALAYEESDDPSGEHTLSTPLTNCPRELRAEILEDYVSRLLTEAGDHLKKTIEARSRALEQAALVGGVLATVTKAPASDDGEKA